MVIARTSILIGVAINGPEMVIALAITWVARRGWQNIARKAAAAEVLCYMKMISYLTEKYFIVSV